MNVNCREEIQRIKANNPEISHREAFSTAAKNVSRHANKFGHLKEVLEKERKKLYNF